MLTSLLSINKNVIINGNSLSHPEIKIDFNSTSSGIKIIGNKTLTLTNVDLKMINPGVMSTIIGPGSIVISQSSSIKY